MERRPNPPGQHGATMRRKVSDYKKQLLEKQRLRAQYNISERQLQNAFTEATDRAGIRGSTCSAAEMRLDAVVMRAGSRGPSTRPGKRWPRARAGERPEVDRPGRRLQPGDQVSLAARSRDMIAFTVPLENARPPRTSISTRTAVPSVRELPEREQIPVQAELSLIVEFYSR